MSKTKRNNKNSKLKDKSKIEKLSEKELNKVAGGAPVGAGHERAHMPAERLILNAPEHEQARRAPPKREAPGTEPVYQNVDAFVHDESHNLPQLKPPRLVEEKNKQSLPDLPLPLSKQEKAELPWLDQTTRGAHMSGRKGLIRSEVAMVKQQQQEEQLTPGGAFNRAFAQSEKGPLGQHDVSERDFATTERDFSEMPAFQEAKLAHDEEAALRTEELRSYKPLEGEGKIKAAKDSYSETKSRGWLRRNFGSRDVGFDEKRTKEFAPERRKTKEELGEVAKDAGSADYQFLGKVDVDRVAKPLAEAKEKVSRIEDEIKNTEERLRKLDSKTSREAEAQRKRLEELIVILTENKEESESIVEYAQASLDEITAKFNAGQKIQHEGDTIGEAPADLTRDETVERVVTSNTNDSKVTIHRNALLKKGFYATEKDWAKAERLAYAKDYGYSPYSFRGTIRHLLRNTGFMKRNRAEPSSGLQKTVEMHNNFKSMMRELKSSGHEVKSGNPPFVEAKKFFADRLNAAINAQAKADGANKVYEHSDLEQLYAKDQTLGNIANNFIGEKERVDFENAILESLNANSDDEKASSGAKLSAAIALKKEPKGKTDGFVPFKGKYY